MWGRTRWSPRSRWTRSPPGWRRGSTCWPGTNRISGLYEYLCSIRKRIIRILFQERVNTFNWKKKNINNNMSTCWSERNRISGHIFTITTLRYGWWCWTGSSGACGLSASAWADTHQASSLPRQASNMHILDRPPRTDRTTTISLTSPKSYFTVQGRLCVSIVLLCWSTQQYPTVQVWI